MSDNRREFLREFMRYQHRIYRFIMSLVPDADEADDLLQQVSMTLWQRWDTFDPERSEFIHWALGVARNHVRNYIRTRARNKKHVVFDETLLEELADVRIQEEQLFEEQREALSNCLKRLSMPHRALVENFYNRTASVGDIASSYGISRRSLTRYISRIRQALMDCILRHLAKGAAE